MPDPKGERGDDTGPIEQRGMDKGNRAYKHLRGTCERDCFVIELADLQIFFYIHTRKLFYIAFVA